jgi:hypothetical protein
VDQEQDANPFAAKAFQVSDVGGESVVAAVEARPESRREQRLDL